MFPKEEALEIQIPEAEVAEDHPEAQIKARLQEEVAVDNKTAEEEDEEEEAVTTISRTLTKATFNVTTARSLATTAMNAEEGQIKVTRATFSVTTATSMVTTATNAEERLY
jgi:hypothetical protein